MAPDFLCIGAQKAGTTWLHENLRQHPGVWMPPVKEVHYFDKAIRHPSPFDRRFYSRRWRTHFTRRLGQRFDGTLGLRELRWDLNFFFARRSDDWYASIFEPGRDLCSGEITPGYSKLEPDEVAHVHSLCPDARIVFLMRDPIDRAWSGARMSSDRRGLDLADEARWRGYLDQQKKTRGDYLRTLRNWKASYGEERLLVGFFEEIAEDPAGLLTRVHSFLGLETGPELIPETATRRFNASSERSMPPEVEAHLAAMYIDDLHELHGMFGAPIEPWVRRAERVLAGTQVGT